ncbi:MAG: CIA30 family protein [Candidatus Margulisbacteria bacterium]|jgi:hypothetical protein|nr:CIA30 family protein [Candidatus Margulisiibacteriota bacterium]
MKKIILTLLFSVCVLLSAAQTDKNSAYDSLLILDNFDDANLTAAPEWWVFDGLKTAFNPAEKPEQGKYYLQLSGETDNYYIGGLGFYFGRAAVRYDALVLDVKGSGAGLLKIQLFDDDNNTYQLEQDQEFQPLYDDQYEYELAIDWTGWRTIEIPLSRFVDVNPGTGDDIWNPAASGGSGGLLHAQLIIMLEEAAGSVNIGLDNLSLARNKVN